MSETIHDVCADAVAWFETLSQGDADAAVDTLVERIIAVLRRDPRMPPLTGEQWRLLFADAVAKSRDELGELVAGAADVDDVVDAIAEAIGDKIVSSKRQKRKAVAATAAQEEAER